MKFFSVDHVETENFQFELENDCSIVWTVLSGTDGESIKLRPGAIDEADLFFAQDVGYTKIVDASDPKIGAVLYRKIELVTAFMLFDTVLIGIRLAVDDASFLDVFNAGDDLALKVNNEHPMSKDAAVSKIEFG